MSRILIVALALFGCVRLTLAVPVLQLYIEGATYDSGTQSWFKSGDGTFRVWAIGNIAGEGGKGPIEGAKLSFAYDFDPLNPAGPSITVTPSKAGGADVGSYSGFLDPSLANAAGHVQTVTDGSTPKLGDGSPLPSHGAFGPGVAWQEFSIGNFTKIDSQISDFIYGFPTAGSKLEGEIMVYDVTVTGVEDIHIDLYNHTQSKNNVKYWKAPFSHDAEGGIEKVPEVGATAILLAISVAGLALARRKLS